MTETKKVAVPEIYKAIHEVRTNLPALEKNGVGPSAQGSYKFLSIDDILSAVAPLENKHGIVSYLVDTEMEFHYNTAPETGKEGGRVRKENVQGYGHFTFRYVAVKDGSYIDHVVPAEGIDSQDKATRKTVTQAQKIANITLYNIITGEPDPDSQAGGADATDPGSSATKPVAQPAPPARKTWMQRIKDDFTEPGKFTGDQVKELRENIKAESGNANLTGDALYEKVYKRLETMGQKIG